MSTPSRSSRKRNAPARNPNRPAPLPPLSDWKPQQPDPVPPSRRHTLPYSDQVRQRTAHEVLNHREQLIWFANSWNDSVAQTELIFTKMFHQPQVLPQDDKITYRDLKAGDVVPEAIMELIREDEGRTGKDVDTRKNGKTRDVSRRDETAKARMREDVSSSRGKKAVPQQKTAEKPSIVQQDDKMDMDLDESEDEDEGGVPVAPPAFTSGKRRKGGGHSGA